MVTLHIPRARVRLNDGGRSFSLDVEDFRLEPGDMVALSGPSGSGKTLCLELCGLMRPADAGSDITVSAGRQTVRTDALWESRAGRDALCRLRATVFGYVAQRSNLLPFLTARENIELPGEVQTRRQPRNTDSLLEDLGLSDVAELKPDALSIGQRHRVAIARALWSDPCILIADEPTAALDPQTARTTLQLLVRAAEASHASLLIASHDHALTNAFAIPRIETTIEADAAGGRAVMRFARCPS